MKVRALKPFHMGHKTYQAGEIISGLEDWRITRLIGEGLVEVLSETEAADVDKATTPAPADTAQPAPDAVPNASAAKPSGAKRTQSKKKA